MASPPPARAISAAISVSARWRCSAPTSSHSAAAGAGHSARSRRNCITMMFAGRIIAPDQDNTTRDGRLAHPARAQHTVQHAPHRQQILQRAQRPRRRRPGPTTVQISPRRRNEHPAAVRQHQQQLKPAMPAHPADQL